MLHLGIAHLWHFVLLAMCCYCTHHVTGQCVMEDKVGYQGADTGSTGVTDPIASFDECKAYCLADDDCMAAEFRFSFACLVWNQDPQETVEAGSTIALKVCTPVACSVSQSANTDASNNAFEVTISSFTTCQDACKLLGQCQHAVYITASNTCNLYNTTSSTSSQSGHMSAVKKACASGTECCFDETSDQTRSDSPTLVLTTSLSACEDLCLSIDTCNASVFTGSSCKIFTEVPVTTSVSGRTLSQKSCPAGASQGNFTYTESCDAEVPACSMDQTANTDASNFIFEETLNSYATCKDACEKLTQCQHAVYITASNTCNLYNTTSTTTSASGHMSAVKQACSSGSGEECCFNETTDETRSDSPILTLTATISACEDLCLSVDSCSASVFTGSSCKIFTESPSTTSVSGRTLSEKSCPAGASPGSFTYTSICNTGTILGSLSGAIVLALSVVVMFYIQSS